MKVLYFSQAALAAGCREEIWEVGLPLSLDAFWEEAVRRHPKLEPLRPQCRVASGGEYVPPGGQILPQEEAAVIPPVSGG